MRLAGGWDMHELKKKFDIVLSRSGETHDDGVR